ncbi:ribosome maturation factor RimP [Geitlerinema splendidum]|nr:ribosome maturation factor RimP [Geitlerinema splendidum]
MGRGPLFLLHHIVRNMSIENRILEIITPSLEEKGYHIVRIQLQGLKRKTLQIMIEKRDESQITVDDCAFVSRIASVLLDVNDPIHESYDLEVTSPGLDRPLVIKEDYKRFAGSMVKIELKVPYEGRQRFHGLLLGVEGDLVKLELSPEKEVTEFAFSDIKKAKLIPNYEMSQ